ncbi:DUF2254 domain-containing protein [Chelativorans sp. ZYF759]|uniref:DUF2254 domain-containing protein n=1 Tax=Chelativorans sp. ZYF759 TaxID=2692213 RepID=UPI00145F30CC|nr:DUF2254 domain-containing protein [Chelativorans sp. ZYF759]NMG38182.1 DUF2254 domain-containing protein [Chelativorans sp. ZYF759]
MDRLSNFLAMVSGQLWLVPAFFFLSAGALAFLLLSFGGEFVSPEGEIGWWLYGGEADTARNLLSALLSGLMTMTSLVVSVTFVILTLAANQLGPRLIAIFMADKQIQSVLGLFVGTILYLILVLRSIGDTLGPDGVPHFAVTTGTILTVLCLMALLFYIHKIARSIIADNVVEVVASELQGTIHRIMPPGNDIEPPLQETAPVGSGWSTSLGKAGYLQVVDYDRLLHIACEQDAVIEVRVRAGHHLLGSGDHLVIHARQRPDEALLETMRGAFTIGRQRTAAQDPEHGIRQLVEIATRALSPGTNDPFTAIAVIDRLGACFEIVMTRPQQRRIYRDQDGKARVLADRASLSGMLEAAFNPIRQAGAGHPAILIRMVETIGELKAAAAGPGERSALASQLARIAETAAGQPLTEADTSDVADALRASGHAA